MRNLLALLLTAVLLLSLLPAGSVQAAEPTGAFQEMLDRAEEIVNYACTPTVRIAVWNENPYNGKMYFEAGEVVHGMPYTLFSRELGVKSMITLREYKAVADKNYSVSHFCNAVWGMRTGPVYGSCCATFICEILGEGFLNSSGVPIYSSVGPLARDGLLTSRKVKASEILPGDLLYDKDWSHIVWVGSVTEKTVTVYEQTPPISKATTIPLTSVTDDGYLIIRNHVYAFASRSNRFRHSGAHVPVYDAPKEPTCTEDGLTAGSHCAICGENIEMQMAIPAYGHTRESIVEETPCTDTEDGWTVYHCAVCGEDEKVWNPSPRCAANRFSDTPLGEWYHEYVDFVCCRDYMNGMSETVFAPDATMSRAMLVTVLWRYAGQPESGSSAFTDVPDGAWYSDAVAWAASKGVVNGVGGGRFDPEGAVTRAQFATVLHRYAAAYGLPAEPADALEFPDRAAVPDWALDAMRWAVAEALIAGSSHADGINYLDPQSAATRAQVAKMLTQFIRNVAEAAEETDIS